MRWAEGFIVVDWDTTNRRAWRFTRLFRAALAVAGRPARAIDGEGAFLAGARHLAEQLQ